MKLTHRRAAVVCFVVTGLVGCGQIDNVYPEPEPPETLLTQAKVSVPAPELEAFQKHESAALVAYNSIASVPLGHMYYTLDGYGIEIVSDVRWSEKYQRLYFVRNDLAPGWFLWGLTDCKNKTIFLADDVLTSGVLAHEFGHVFDECRTTHEEQRVHGYEDAVKATVKALVAASGAFDSEPVVDGVLDAE